MGGHPVSTSSGPRAENLVPFTPPELVERTLTRSRERLAHVRAVVQRPLTFAEKIVLTHLRDLDGSPRRGVDYIQLDPDRLALPDSSALMAMLQLMTTGDHQVPLPRRCTATIS